MKQKKQQAVMGTRSPPSPVMPTLERVSSSVRQVQVSPVKARMGRAMRKEAVKEVRDAEETDEEDPDSVADEDDSEEEEDYDSSSESCMSSSSAFDDVSVASSSSSSSSSASTPLRNRSSNIRGNTARKIVLREPTLRIQGRNEG